MVVKSVGNKPSLTLRLSRLFISLAAESDFHCGNGAFGFITDILLYTVY